MLKLSKAQIDDRLDSLSPVLKKALFSWDTARKINLICRFLKVEKVTVVADLVGEVLLGFLSIDDFPSRLAADLPELSPQTINSLAQRIKTEIFNPIREEIIKNYSPVVAEIKKPPPVVKKLPEVKKPEAKKPIVEKPSEVKKPAKLPGPPKITPAKIKKPPKFSLKKLLQIKLTPVKPEPKKPLVLFKRKPKIKAAPKLKPKVPVTVPIGKPEVKPEVKPFMLVTERKPKIKTPKRKPIYFWFREKPVVKPEEKIEAKVELKEEELKKPEEIIERVEIKPKKKKIVRYERPRITPSPFGKEVNLEKFEIEEPEKS